MRARMVLKEENTVKGNKHCIRFFTDLLIVIIHSTNKRENPPYKNGSGTHAFNYIYIYFYTCTYTNVHIYRFCSNFFYNQIFLHCDEGFSFLVACIRCIQGDKIKNVSTKSICFCFSLFYLWTKGKNFANKNKNSKNLKTYILPWMTEAITLYPTKLYQDFI